MSAVENDTARDRQDDIADSCFQGGDWPTYEVGEDWWARRERHDGVDEGWDATPSDDRLPNGARAIGPFSETDPQPRATGSSAAFASHNGYDESDIEEGEVEWELLKESSF